MSDWKQRNHKFSKSMADAQFTYIEAEIENSKLQKLAMDMWECIKEYADELDAEVHGYIWPYVTDGYGNKVRNGEGDFVGFPDRMRELGIEVPDERHRRTDNRTTEKKSPTEVKGDCTICKGWVDDGRGGTCVFTDDFWTPHCPYDKEVDE